MNRWLKLLIALIICYGSGYLSGLIAGNMSQNIWFKSLQIPEWYPPRMTFAIVWPIIFFLLSISLWIVWMKRDTPKSAYWAFGIQMALNFVWSPIYFRAESTMAGFVFSALLWISVWAMIILFGRVSKLAAWLNVPYLLWATFSLSLILKIYRLN